MIETFIQNLKSLFGFSKTKLLGFLVFATGTYYGFGNVASTDAMGVMLQSWYLSSLLVGGKTITAALKEIKLGGK